MRLISYSEWLNDTLYFQDPIHPDCLQQSYPISSESLYPEDADQFFKSAQDFPWRCDYTSPWNNDQSYLKFGIGTARQHYCTSVRQPSEPLPTPRSPAEPCPWQPPDFLQQVPAGLVPSGFAPQQAPLALMPLPRAGNRESLESVSSWGPCGSLPVPPVPRQCHLEVLDLGLKQPRQQHLILQDFFSATSAIFGNGCRLLLPANGKE